MIFHFNKNQVYDTRFFVYTYNDNNIRIVKSKYCRKPGFEVEKKEGTFDYNSEEVKRCSLSRTKRMIRELSLCNDFSHFATLTINSDLADRYSLDKSDIKNTFRFSLVILSLCSHL